MRSRHTIIELTDADEAPMLRSFSSAPTFDDGSIVGVMADLIADEPALEDVELIDESVASQPSSSPLLGSRVERPAARSGSAVPTSRPINQARPTLAWGLGTDGWPHYNSRLVRLFACHPTAFAHGVAGGRWDCLTLAGDIRSARDGQLMNDGWPQVISGTLQMPYRSRPLEVELQVQPFHDRYARVDIVLRSRHRWPRRYFDVASRCLTPMQRLERPQSSLD